MQIKMADKVVEWYKEDLSLTTGDCVRFFVRYGGFNSFVKGYSLGIDKEAPEHANIRVEKDGITFFVEDNDAWYFDDKDLVIKFNEKLGEPEFVQGA